MNKVFYIHGFGSSSNSNTRTMLQEQLGEPVVGLSYDYTNPQLSLYHMKNEIVESLDDDRTTVIGSSLGGWYANKLSDMIAGVDFVYYNPTTRPWESLGKYSVSQTFLDRYSSADYENSGVLKNSRAVVLSGDDDVVDPTIAQKEFRRYCGIHFTGGGHRMTQENAKLIAERVLFMRGQLL